MDEAVGEAESGPVDAREALLDGWVDVQQRAAVLYAEEVRLLACRLDLLAAEPDVASGSDVSLRSLAGEYGAAVHIPPATAAVRLTDAWLLVHRFPRIVEALEDGRISAHHARVILAETPLAADDDEESARRWEQYETRVLEFAEQDTASRTRAYARGVCTALDPEGTVAAHRKARAARSVTVTPDGDGMAVLTALLPEMVAYAIKDRLTAQARALKKASAEHDAPLRKNLPGDLTGDAPASADVAGTPKAAGSGSGEQSSGLWEHGDDDPAPWEAGFSSTPTVDDAGAVFIGPEDFDPLSPEAERYDASIEAQFAAIIAGLEPTNGEHAIREERVFPAPEDPIGVRLDDERTMDQLRADLLCDLLLTADPTATDPTSTDSTGAALRGIRATVQVTIRATTLVGQDDLPAELDGHGPLDPDWARSLAGTAPSLDRLFLDNQGMLTATDSYTPTANMKRYLKARDQHCRFPGCRRPPHDCQIDHNQDHAKGGPTALSNLALFCTGHHPIKHPHLFDDDRWTATQQPGGIIDWTSPLGRTYTDHPAPRVMFV